MHAPLPQIPVSQIRTAAGRSSRRVTFFSRALSAGVLQLALCGVQAGPAVAHATEQPFIQLLPTHIYIGAGIAAVLATIILISMPRAGAMLAGWRARQLGISLPEWTYTASSLASLILLALLLLAGWKGSTDPLANPLTLVIWVVWWIMLVLAQVLAGDVWRWFNPWTGFISLLRPMLPSRNPVRMPKNWGVWPATALFLLFVLFQLADPAPADPRRLAAIAGLYVLFTFAGIILTGKEAWLHQCEFITVFMRKLSLLAPLGADKGALHAGLPGWQLLSRNRNVSSAIFVIAMLAAGSFESLYATFSWLSLIGVNPLEFPGRSAIFRPTVLGLLGVFGAASVLFGLVVLWGLILIGARERFREAFCRQALCLLPIVAGYHFAHFLTSLLIDGQHLFLALNDPFVTGANLLGASGFHVTTGFLNTRDSVRLIWLAQAGAVVAGHILAIIVSHAVAVNMFRSGRDATVSQSPISIFMIFYTFFGLWLLASPRGM